MAASIRGHPAGGTVVRRAPIVVPHTAASSARARIAQALVLALILAAPAARAEAPADEITPAPRAALPDFAAHARLEAAVVVSLVATGARRESPAAAGRRELDPDDGDEDLVPDDVPRVAPPVAAVERSLASGIVIDADGLIITSAHAVAGLDDITVYLADQRQYPARLVGLDELSDVAVLKIDAHGLRAAAIGDASRLAVGDWVAALGAPFGLERTLTAGIVSALPRYFPELGGLPLIQSDVALNRGSSGGALFNLRGEVVGMNALMFSDTGAYVGVSFSLPIDVALSIAETLRQHGHVQRARLGARFQDVTPGLAQSFGLERAAGALVTRVEARSGAQAAGLRSGDVIAGLDGRRDMDAAALQQQIARSRPGSAVMLNVWRAGTWLRLSATVEAVPGAAPAAAAPASAALPRLGLQLRELDGAERRLQDGAGLQVRSARGAAQRAGVRPGDLILAVNETAVSRLAEFDAALQQRGPARPPALLVRRGRAYSYLLVQARDAAP